MAMKSLSTVLRATFAVLPPMILLAMVSSLPNARAGTLTTLLSFDGTNGAYPYGSLTLSGSTLYGMTSYGGGAPEGWGNIFSINTDGTNPETLFSFNGPNGGVPHGSLTLSGSTLYGMTTAGGPGGWGKIFSIKTNGSSFQTLWSFSGGGDGAWPNGDLTLSGSTLYGMTPAGGANVYGTIFSINTNGSSFQTLRSFSPNIDGAYPYGSLTLSGSTLYGMTSGGGLNWDGTIFSINTNGTNPEALFSFSGTNGNSPRGSLTLSESTLYGMTESGGADGWGNIFSINTNGSGFQNLLSFSGVNGAYPYGSLTLSGSTLYGMTTAGGPNDYGMIFSINTDGTGFQTLWSFSGGIDGAHPYGDLTLSGLTLYGMTKYGGMNNKGVIFSLIIPEPSSAALLATGAIALLAFACVVRWRRTRIVC